MIKQFEQNLIRLILQPQPNAISAQLPGMRFQLKNPKAIRLESHVVMLRRSHLARPYG
jgi:hypothetical protein